MATLETLRSHYRRVQNRASQRELARQEDEMWKAFQAQRQGPGRGPRRRTWLREQFGGGLNQYEFRATLYHAGAVADPLWEEIDVSNLPLQTARRRLQGLLVDRAAKGANRTRSGSGHLPASKRPRRRKSKKRKAKKRKAKKRKAKKCQPAAPTSSAEKLIERYRDGYDTLPLKELARLAGEIYETAGYGERGERGAWLAEALGGTAREHRATAYMLARGELAEPLWKLIAGGVFGARTAQDLLCEARRSANPVAALQGILEDRYGHVAFMRTNGLSQKAKRFLTSMEAAAASFTAEYAEGIDEAETRATLKEFTGTLQVVCRHFHGQLQRKRKERPPAERIGRVSFDQARLVFALAWKYSPSLTEAGREKQLSELRRQFSTRLHELHPDKHRGSRAFESELQAVYSAHTVLRQYLQER